MDDISPDPRPSPPAPAVNIAVIGDVHLDWNRFDVDYFNASNYDLLLFVGDIAGYRHRGALPIARSIAALTVPAIAMPGNHDAIHLGQLVAEALEKDSIANALSGGQPRRSRQLDRALGEVTMGGYRRHPIEVGGRRLSVISARPHSMGGPRLAFRRYLGHAFGVASIDDSVNRLNALVDECGDEPIIFLAHNGPSGFGDRRDDIWGCDFRSSEGDFGDPDLAQAIAYARASGRRVAAVTAGHMHHHLKGGGRRRWSETRDGILYLNAARVPRIFSTEGIAHHHHIEITVPFRGDASPGGEAHARERLIHRP